jgi:hypothetical protein
VFDVGSPDGIVRAVRGEDIGTRIGFAPSELQEAPSVPVARGT